MVDLDGAMTWVRSHVDAGLLPGAVLGVATRDGVVAVEAVGDAAPTDRYALFSITKVLVGLVAAEHVARGRLSLDTPLAQAVPGFGREREDVVRLRHLVSHTSGIVEQHLDAPADLDAALVTAGQAFSAGAARQYSTLAFQGVARLIEHADPTPWETQLARLLARAGAGGITMDAADTSHPPAMTGSLDFDWQSFAAERNPGAGASGTAQDLLALAVSLLRDDGRAVTPAALAAIREPLTVGVPDLDPTSLRDHESGIAWKLRTRTPGLRTTDGMGHGGWAGTQLWIHPDRDVAYVLLTNVLGAVESGLDEVTLGARLTS